MKDKEIIINDNHLTKGLILKTGEKCTLILPTFAVTLQIDPADPSAKDDTYTLYSVDEECYFNKTLTIEDDQVQGNEFLELHYYPVRTDKKYSLSINPGEDGEIYHIFEDNTL
ncbi:MAG: hypothetical protein JXJ04_11685 [Spirochaetales bacterium]|nr:hypothetical protein [Spirochaetales bacterium]